jgi:hypothetical protein
MSHGDAVVDSYRVELKRNTPRSSHGVFNELAEPLQVGVPRDNVDVRIHDRNKRLVHVLITDACGFEQRSMWGSIDPFLDPV